MRRTALSLLAAGLVAGMLAGCSIRVDEGQDAVISTPVPAATTAAPAPTAQPVAPTSTAPSAGVDTTSNLRTRDEAIALADSTIACTPGLVIPDDGRVVRVEGACDDVTVSGFAAVVILDDVSTLTVTGDGLVVYAKALTDLSVSGDVNTVVWRGSAPRVDDTGVATTVLRDER
ncbi:DUF3060 domain-containing protein [Microbacterium sp. CFBP 8790]|uniref:DUF3060 domain-containing protein n=1 Tax=unclassified Microbacterium TaxID=2609290 RepID=UPI00177F09BB|nr:MULTISPECIES: DUF3060 domain-containing protein [unclassified Microbacterium]MBD8206342.1 DUF3060 domain-containing protein [Microbacterium sp. CFBP 8801]MBD8508462.1 DUF3060 domain-containing protein [Microbacterium sp. CFBP 8790]